MQTSSQLGLDPHIAIALVFQEVCSGHGVWGPHHRKLQERGMSHRQRVPWARPGVMQLRFSTLLGLYRTEINKEMLVPLLIMYSVSTPTLEDSVFIPISLTY